MQSITFNEIDQSWNKMEEMELDDVPQLVDQLGHKQPFVLAYLMATGNDILNQSEREALLFMGLMIWHISNRNIVLIPEISGELIDQTEQKNVKMLEYLAGEPESDFLETVEKIIGKYNQQELLKYVIDRLMNEPQRSAEIREDNIGMLVIYLKTLIDCVDLITKE